jgi:hypothetical protein
MSVRRDSARRMIRKNAIAIITTPNGGRGADMPTDSLQLVALRSSQRALEIEH